MTSVMSCGPPKRNSLHDEEPRAKGEQIQVKVVSCLGVSLVVIAFERTPLFGQAADPHLKASTLLREPMAVSIGVKSRSTRMHEASDNSALKRIGCDQVNPTQKPGRPGC
jgi:hypothetical protein